MALHYYILVENHTEGMGLHELLLKENIKNRIAPAPRDTDGKVACGMCILVDPEELEKAKECLERNQAHFVKIVALDNQLKKGRDRYC